MHIKVRCDGCDQFDWPSYLRRYNLLVLCVECFADVVARHNDDDVPYWSALPHLPPILAMEPGPPRPQKGEDAQYLVRWADGTWSLLTWWGHKWSEIVPAKGMLYHVQLPGGQDE